MIVATHFLVRAHGLIFGAIVKTIGENLYTAFHYNSATILVRIQT